MLLPLFPHAKETQALEGTYLNLKLHQQSKLIIYSNFIASLDGRISLLNKQKNYVVPSDIANKRDWRLYQELAAQADVMLTSARYFRQLAQGCAQDLLPVGQGDYADLLSWRKEQGLKNQPDVVIFSRSLDIPLTALEIFQRERQIHIFCPESSDEQQQQRFERHGISVYCAGKHNVEAEKVRYLLNQLAYRSAYMIAGPQMHQCLLEGQQLDRLFLTQHFSLLGQADFHCISTPEMSTYQFNLLSTYLDQQEGQMFMQFQLKKLQ